LRDLHVINKINKVQSSLIDRWTHKQICMFFKFYHYHLSIAVWYYHLDTRQIHVQTHGTICFVTKILKHWQLFVNKNNLIHVR
jgi:hypothetical protein